MSVTVLGVLVGLNDTRAFHIPTRWIRTGCTSIHSSYTITSTRFSASNARSKLHSPRLSLLSHYSLPRCAHCTVPFLPRNLGAWFTARVTPDSFEGATLLLMKCAYFKVVFAGVIAADAASAATTAAAAAAVAAVAAAATSWACTSSKLSGTYTTHIHDEVSCLDSLLFGICPQGWKSVASLNFYMIHVRQS